MEDLLEDRGTARGLIEKQSGESELIEMPLRYRRVSGAEALPKKIGLRRVPEEERERLILVFRRTLEPRILILACIEEKQRDERILSALTRRCLEDLQEFAFRSVFGSAWMTAVSRIATQSSEAPGPVAQPGNASG